MPPVSDQALDAIATLQEPVRRALYRYVIAQGRPVGRSEAAEAIDIARNLAAFHLDRLVDDGLLVTEYRRMTDRTGPGAGRPSKLYLRSNQQVDVTLPPRSYELAARLFARTLDADIPLQKAAEDFGRSLGAEARALASDATDPQHLQDAAETVLATYGFEPFLDHQVLRLRNCPFHALALEHRTLVCGMNLSIMRGLTTGLGLTTLEAILDPQPNTCCVAFVESE